MWLLWFLQVWLNFMDCVAASLQVPGLRRMNISEGWKNRDLPHRSGFTRIYVQGIPRGNIAIKNFNAGLITLQV